MRIDESARLNLPAIDDLGRDLLLVTPLQRVISIGRPLACVAAYFAFALAGWWIPAVLAVAGLMFITYVSTSHDLLHRTLGLSRSVNEAWLSIIEALTLRSGHAFRVTHLNHHRLFPHEDDIEGEVADKPWWRALLAGMGNQTRLFVWAFPRARSEERRWMIVEAVSVIAVIGAGVVLLPTTPVLIVYVLLIVTSSWLYPFATVWVPHRTAGKSALDHTIAVRGRLVPALFLQHTYHLEHHLYPSVPSHNWPELARRLDPWLRQQGVKPIRVP